MATTIHTALDLGRAVRAARLELGMTQDDLALASGTGRRFIVNLESGKATVRLESVLEVLAALELRIELHRGRARGSGSGPDAGA
ncbi:MAG TPA: helix-turn-helix domain-containing protein [Thermoleophilaceae bacterium]|nr:helix-turn-helix domain-containing protein [Thermoleophilaceae bacterium]